DVPGLRTNGVKAADHHVLDGGGIEVTSLDDGADDVGAEVCRMGVREAAAAPADRRSHRVDDVCLGHGCLLRWDVLQMPTNLTYIQNIRACCDEGNPKPLRTKHCAVLMTAVSEPCWGFHHSGVQFSAPITSILAARRSRSARIAPAARASSSRRRHSMMYSLPSARRRLRTSSGSCPRLRVTAVAKSDSCSSTWRCACTAAPIRSIGAVSAASADSADSTCSRSRRWPTAITSAMSASRESK